MGPSLTWYLFFSGGESPLLAQGNLSLNWLVTSASSHSSPGLSFPICEM